jgi:hypothetical protein
MLIQLAQQQSAIETFESAKEYFLQNHVGVIDFHMVCH